MNSPSIPPSRSDLPIGLGRSRQPAAIRYAASLRSEFEHLNIRLLLADLAVAVLPALCFCRLRAAIYRLAGFRIGPRTMIFGRITLRGPGRIQDRLRIGADGIVNSPCHFDLSGPIEVGDGVTIGHHVVFVTAQHDIGPPERRAGAVRPRPIVLAHGCWVGANGTLLPGVTVGAGSIVAAGAVVSRDVDPGYLVGGVPARIIRALAKAAVTSDAAR